MLAGKTRRQKACQFYGQEHPRARGENWVARSTPWRQNGTSPRTRGKLPQRQTGGYVTRNIPAHAGKTPRTISCVIWVTEHPRARGENALFHARNAFALGTSPRTRGKLIFLPVWLCSGSEHPRARGENQSTVRNPTTQRGTSPRTRGKLEVGPARCCPDRNIPAHAGKT